VTEFSGGCRDGETFVDGPEYLEAGIGRVTQRVQAAPKVAILMCTYHGQHYLADQLDSFAAQTHTNWELWVSDDGSKDDTHAILNAYIKRWGGRHLSLHSGPAEGFVANFLSLACKASIEADYYAFSDQDDIWEVDKLQRSVKWLRTIPQEVPAIYCSRTRLVDFENKEIGLSPLFQKPPSFANALMQNIGGGNTMVFNNAARDLLRFAGDDVDVITHDWWSYLVVMACGGRVYYDPIPTLRYRQHDANLVGANGNFAARLARVKMLWNGRFKDLNDQHIRALERLKLQMTDENKAILAEFRTARDRSLFPRVLGFVRMGLHRQTLLGNIGLVFATLFKKM
jgi:glycosyltransferase involved in cell wall biosynthesis